MCRGRLEKGTGVATISCDFHVYAMRRHRSPLQRPSPFINTDDCTNLFFTEPSLPLPTPQPPEPTHIRFVFVFPCGAFRVVGILTVCAFLGRSVVHS